MASEQWDLYDAQERRTGRIMNRGENVPTGLYHLAVHIWPVNAQGEFLIQRRAPCVQWKPNLWAVTGGSAVAGEDAMEAACRELHEEIGYDAREKEMHKVACLRRTNSFCHVFSLRIDWPLTAFTLQKEEVSALMWCDSAKIARMAAEGAFYNYGDSYFKMIFEYGRRMR